MFILLLGILFSVFAFYQLVKLWYWRQVNIAQANVHHVDGSLVPGQPPTPIVGNIPDVYQADNQLSAYNAFHQKFGEIVQILWLWRHQISLASYPMALQILGPNQHQYEKFRPNALLRRLYGSSVLTNNGPAWKRHRLILNEFFTEKAVLTYHPTMVQLTQRLIDKWQARVRQGDGGAQIEICADLNPLFLDIVTQITVGESVGALDHAADGFLQNLTYILKASTQPQHQFVSWWRFVPIPQNLQLSRALVQVDAFLAQLIAQHKATQSAENLRPKTVLDKLLLSAAETAEHPLTHAEIKDNLLAIIGNGYETVATTLAMTLQALSQDPSKLARASQEVQAVLAEHNQQLTPGAVAKLFYIEAVLYESMRLYPAVAGLQRISLAPDVLEGWSIPAQQVVGITLQPLHLHPDYYGESPETFCPERYLNGASEATPSESRCPFKRLTGFGDATPSQSVRLPLTFGHGARQCLAKHLALYEMKVVLAMLLGEFGFETVSQEPAALELGKFGLFISAFPQGGVQLKVHSIKADIEIVKKPDAILVDR